jgi:colicin import membrane protein
MSAALALDPRDHDAGDATLAFVGALAVHAFAAWLAVTTLALPSRELEPIAQPQVIEAEVIDARVLEAEVRRLREAAEAEQRDKDQALAQQNAIAEQKRIDDARLSAERDAAERRKREEAIAKAKAEEEAKARELAREKREAAAQVQREKELKAQVAAEERRRKAERSGAMTAYIAALDQKVRRNWLQPALIPDGLECLVQVEQLPTGDVVRVKVLKCNGDEVVQRSIEDAVLKASPLPTPSDRTLYSRIVEFNFKPTK